MAKAVKCPICNGEGKIEKQGNTLAIIETCHGCEGKGWVEVSNH